MGVKHKESLDVWMCMLYCRCGDKKEMVIWRKRGLVCCHFSKLAMFPVAKKHGGQINLQHTSLIQTKLLSLLKAVMRRETDSHMER